MATLAELRTELGISLGMMRQGVTTSSGSATSLIDTTGLQNFATSGMLVGATLYIPSLSEWTTINEYDAPNHTLKWDTSLSQVVGADEPYELYMPNLPFEAWEQAINKAIEDGWPEIWLRTVHSLTDMSTPYALALPVTVHSVLSVDAQHTDSARYDGPIVPIPFSYWRIDETASPKKLVVMRPLNTTTTLHASCREQYPVLSGTEETDMDKVYLMAGASANLYAQLVGKRGAGVEHANAMQMMNYYNEEAKRIKNAIGQALAGQLAPESEK